MLLILCYREQYVVDSVLTMAVCCHSVSTMAVCCDSVLTMAVCC